MPGIEGNLKMHGHICITKNQCIVYYRTYQATLEGFERGFMYAEDRAAREREKDEERLSSPAAVGTSAGYST